MRRLQQVIGDQKPLLDRLSKTGSALAKLLADDDAEQVGEVVDADTSRYNELKTAARERAHQLEDALQQTAEVTSYFGKSFFLFLTQSCFSSLRSSSSWTTRCSWQLRRSKERSR